jgi:ATP-dependent Lon protease
LSNWQFSPEWLNDAALSDFGVRTSNEWAKPIARPRSSDGLIEAPLLPMRETVLFPHMTAPLFVGRDRSMKAIEAAHTNNESLVVVAQRDVEIEDPRPEDLHRLGTEVLIGRMLRMPDGTTSVLTQGQRRAEIVDFIQLEPYFRVKARLLEDTLAKPPATEALMRAVLALFEKVTQLNRALPEDAYVYAMNVAEPGWLADLVAATLDLDIRVRQEVLEILDPAGQGTRRTGAGRSNS